MEKIKRGWHGLPTKVRKPLVLTVGLLVVAISPVIGWIPGPGGMIVFLLGVAILSSEFEWAERFRDYALDLMKQGGKIIKRYPKTSTVLITLAIGASWYGTYWLYFR